MIVRVVKDIFPFFHPKNATFFYVARFCSSAASKSQNPCPSSNLMAEFLITSCGFSSQKAASASKVIAKGTTVEQADSVRQFFKHHGFDDTSIRKIISNYPFVLSASADSTIHPKLKTLSGMGFEEAELQRLITSNPSVIVNPSAIPRLQFWETFLRTDSKKELAKVFARNRGLIGHDIATSISPKISLFKRHGLSNDDIATLVKKGRCLILRKYETIEELLKRAEEIGFDLKSSSMILQGLSSLNCIGKSTFARKMDFFKGLGWSEREFIDAFKKAPFVIHLKEETILEKMEFLVGTMGCKQSYIASRPLLLARSLEKRLKPRHYVMEMLKTNKLIVTESFLYSTVCLTDKDFVKKYITPFMEHLPKLHEIYIAACDGRYDE